MKLKRYVTLLLVLSGALSVCLVANAALPVYDTFSRQDGQALGTTEDPNAYSWVKTDGAIASIASGALATGEKSGASIGGGFTAADFDLTVDATATAPGWMTFGINFRAATPTADTVAGSGYWLGFNGVGQGYLFKNGVYTTWFNGPGNWASVHTIRLLTMGDRIQAFADGGQVLDYTDTGSLGAGYLTLGNNTAGTVATFDNLRIADVPEPSSLLALCGGALGLAGMVRRKRR